MWWAILRWAILSTWVIRIAHLNYCVLFAQFMLYMGNYSFKSVTIFVFLSYQVDGLALRWDNKQDIDHRRTSQFEPRCQTNRSRHQCHHHVNTSVHIKIKDLIGGQIIIKDHKIMTIQRGPKIISRALSSIHSYLEPLLKRHLISKNCRMNTNRFFCLCLQHQPLSVCKQVCLLFNFHCP